MCIDVYRFPSNLGSRYSETGAAFSDCSALAEAQDAIRKKMTVTDTGRRKNTRGNNRHRRFPRHIGKNAGLYSTGFSPTYNLQILPHENTDRYSGTYRGSPMRRLGNLNRRSQLAFHFARSGGDMTELSFHRKFREEFTLHIECHWDTPVIGIWTVR